MQHALNLGPTACCGEVWNENYAGKTYYDGEKRYVVSSSDGLVVVGVEINYGEWVAATEAEQTAALALAAQDHEIARNRQTIARTLANGNEALRFVYSMNMSYEDGPPCLEEFDELPGIQFGQAGRNASHSFYAGATKTGQKFVMSMDVEDYYHGDRAKALHCREVESWDEVGYWGHY